MFSSKELTHLTERLLHSIYFRKEQWRDGASILVSESAICNWGIWKYWQPYCLSYILKINASLSSKDSLFFVNVPHGDWEMKITRKLLNSIYLYSSYHDKLLFQTYSFTSLPKPLVSWSLLYKAPLIYTTPLVSPNNSSRSYHCLCTSAVQPSSCISWETVATTRGWLVMHH